MKRLILSILYGSIIPVLFFIVGQNGRLKDDKKIDYMVAWVFIVLIFILFTLAAYKLLEKKEEKKKINSG